jgi:hypothetical protein
MNKIVFYCSGDRRIEQDDFYHNADGTLNEYGILRSNLRDLKLEMIGTKFLTRYDLENDTFVFLDNPKIKNKILKRIHKKLLIKREPKNIIKKNFDNRLHLEYDLILTGFNETQVDLRYRKYPTARYQHEYKIENYLKSHKAVMINSNIPINKSGEMYKLRQNIIDWYENNSHESFDLWGRGWDKTAIEILGKKIILRHNGMSKSKCYRGITDNKIETLSKYRFAFVIENTVDQLNYISEKIFDCFLGGTVPIYLGTQNIKLLIDPKCFIDYRDFSNIESLNNYLTTMEQQKYDDYISAINWNFNNYHFNFYSMESWQKVVTKSILEVHRLEKY